MLWESEPTGKCFFSLPQFFQTSTSVSIYNLIDTQATCFLILLELENYTSLKENNLFMLVIKI